MNIFKTIFSTLTGGVGSGLLSPILGFFETAKIYLIIFFIVAVFCLGIKTGTKIDEWKSERAERIINEKSIDLSIETDKLTDKKLFDDKFKLKIIERSNSKDLKVDDFIKNVSSIYTKQKVEIDDLLKKRLK